MAVPTAIRRAILESVLFARILASAGGDPGQQVHDRPVLVGRPNAAISRKKLAPALCSPPKQHEPSINPF